MKLYYQNLNNSISFKSKNKNVRKADDIQRRARHVFPVLSSSYIDEFYSSTKIKRNNNQISIKANQLLKKVDSRISAIRKLAKKKDASNSKYSWIDDNIPYTKILDGVKLLKAGNCEECAKVVLAALSANGYYNSQRVSLAVDISYINKKTGECEYNCVEPIDHSFVITSLDNDNPKKNDYVVIDSWLGFADSISGAKARFKQVFDNKALQNLLSFHRSMFRLNKFEQSGTRINFDDYQQREKFVFYSSDNYTPEDFKDLGLYSRIMYENLLLSSGTK